LPRSICTRLCPSKSPSYRKLTVLPLSFRPERSVVEGSAVAAEYLHSALSIQVAILPETNRPPLVIPTGANRSGGTCGFFPGNHADGTRRIFILISIRGPSRTTVLFQGLPQYREESKAQKPPEMINDE
jgi:hypothetical protein